MEIRKGDPKSEKHSPKIIVSREGEFLKIEVSVGSEIPHPNTKEHHIAWIEVYWKPEGGPERMLARKEFLEHGEVEVFPELEVKVKGIEGGKVIALSYCNLHGLWESELEIRKHFPF